MWPRVLDIPLWRCDRLAKLFLWCAPSPPSLAEMIGPDSPGAGNSGEVMRKTGGAALGGYGPPDRGHQQNFVFHLPSRGGIAAETRFNELVRASATNDAQVKSTQYFLEDVEAMGLLKMDFPRSGATPNHDRENQLISLSRTLGERIDPDALRPLTTHFALLAPRRSRRYLSARIERHAPIVRDLKPSSLEGHSRSWRCIGPGPLDAGLIPNVHQPQARPLKSD